MSDVRAGPAARASGTGPTSAAGGAAARRFPDEVVVALHEAGVTLGCLPVRIDDGDWRAALFYVVPPDAPCLVRRRAGRASDRGGDVADDAAALPGAPFAVALEADLHEHASATVVELGIEIRTPGTPLAGSVLFLTGHVSAHFDALTLLAAQPDLPLFIGDEYCRLLASQRVPLGDVERGVFRSLLDEAVGRDAVIRLSGRYDATKAFDEVLHAIGGTASGDGACENGGAVLPRPAGRREPPSGPPPGLTPAPSPDAAAAPSVTSSPPPGPLST